MNLVKRLEKFRFHSQDSLDPLLSTKVSTSTQCEIDIKIGSLLIATAASSAKAIRNHCYRGVTAMKIVMG